MKLKATDTVHVSAVKPDALRPGEEFEIEAGAGRQLIKAGLAVEVAAPAEDEGGKELPEGEKNAPSPETSDETAPPETKDDGPAPRNKAIIGAQKNKAS